MVAVTIAQGNYMNASPWLVMKKEVHGDADKQLLQT